MQQGAREAVVLHTAGGALEADTDPVLRPGQQVGHRQPDGPGEISGQGKLRQWGSGWLGRGLAHGHHLPEDRTRQEDPYKRTCVHPIADHIAHAMRQETSGWYLRKYDLRMPA
ncbi:hypothetical protein GCM10023335_02820 [Streptomyces siamensis]|uniref:Uncharacterized protein n=1 Tax=Streptomyces siamensis TaxID=1274986 RepID=A0ABP9IC14_9ACTN